MIRNAADALRGSFKQLLKALDLVYGADGKSRSLYSLRHMYATFALKAGRDIHKKENGSNTPGTPA